MNIVKLKAGETVFVAAVMPGQGPDQGLPPDLGLGTPEHPIVLPPDPTQPLPPRPDHTLPGSGGGMPGEHPDNTLPPAGEIPPPIEPGRTPGWELKVAWTPATGWFVAALPTGVRTPSTMYAFIMLPLPSSFASLRMTRW